MILFYTTIYIYFLGTLRNRIGLIYRLYIYTLLDLYTIVIILLLLLLLVIVNCFR